MIKIENLTIEFDENIPVTDNINFAIEKNEILGIVGESGSGKSITAYSIMKLLPKGARITNGNITGDFINNKSISMVYQEPMNALDPVMKVGKQIEEAVEIHFSKEKKLNKNERKNFAIEFMENAGLDNCEKLYNYYSHQLSGGMRQRILIAIALACKPELIIADEPTTALDIKTSKRIIERFRKINKKFGTSILLISHDIDVISSICSRILVMKGGKIIEEGAAEDILENPIHEYTKSLLQASLVKKKFDSAKETDHNNNKGCSLTVKNINGYYNDKERVQILNNVSFEIHSGEIFGLVGESGSGKSTLAKIIAGLVKDSEGSILLNGQEINGLSSKERRKYSKDIQIVFQDPFGSLNPKMKVGRIIEEPLRIHKIGKGKEERRKMTAEILSLVGLSDDYYDRYPHELSGGQRQRISIAAALILNPGFIIMDEPVSAVDLLVEVQIIKLIKDIHSKFNTTFLFISHDLKLVKNLCDRIAMIENGKIISIGKPEEIN